MERRGGGNLDLIKIQIPGLKSIYAPQSLESTEGDL